MLHLLLHAGSAATDDPVLYEEMNLSSPNGLLPSFKTTLWISCERICCKIRSAHEETKIVLWNSPPASLFPPCSTNRCWLFVPSAPSVFFLLHPQLWTWIILFDQSLPWGSHDRKYWCSKSNADRLVPRNADLLNNLNHHHSIIEADHVLHLLMINR